MIWRVEIKEKESVFDALGESTARDIADLRITSVSQVQVIQIYTIDGTISENQIRLICERLLVDPITQEYSYTTLDHYLPPAHRNGTAVVEIAYNPGVMDPVEESTIKAIKDLDIPEVRSVRTSRKYLLHGLVSDGELRQITDKVLFNKLIQHVVANDAPARTKSPRATSPSRKFDIVLVDLLGTNDKKLQQLSRQGQLFLNLNEMRAIQKYFRKINRNPTDCELETIAQT